MADPPVESLGSVEFMSDSTSHVPESPDWDAGPAPATSTLRGLGAARGCSTSLGEMRLLFFPNNELKSVALVHPECGAFTHCSATSPPILKHQLSPRAPVCMGRVDRAIRFPTGSASVSSLRPILDRSATDEDLHRSNTVGSAPGTICPSGLHGHLCPDLSHGQTWHPGSIPGAFAPPLPGHCHVAMAVQAYPVPSTLSPRWHLTPATYMPPYAGPWPLRPPNCPAQMCRPAPVDEGSAPSGKS